MNPVIDITNMPIKTKSIVRSSNCKDEIISNINAIDIAINNANIGRKTTLRKLIAQLFFSMVELGRIFFESFQFRIAAKQESKNVANGIT
jgi:hypothetical protein